MSGPGKPNAGRGRSANIINFSTTPDVHARAGAIGQQYNINAPEFAEILAPFAASQLATTISEGLQCIRSTGVFERGSMFETPLFTMGVDLLNQAHVGRVGPERAWLISCQPANALAHAFREFEQKHIDDDGQFTHPHRERLARFYIKNDGESQQQALARTAFQYACFAELASMRGVEGESAIFTEAKDDFGPLVTRVQQEARALCKQYVESLNMADYNKVLRRLPKELKPMFASIASDCAFAHANAQANSQQPVSINALFGAILYASFAVRFSGNIDGDKYPQGKAHYIALAGERLGALKRWCAENSFDASALKSLIDADTTPAYVKASFIVEQVVDMHHQRYQAADAAPAADAMAPSASASQ